MPILEPIHRCWRYFQVLVSTYRWASMVFRESSGGGMLTPEARERILCGWSKEVLEILKIKVTVVGKPSSEPMLFIGNHKSYVDIPLLMAQTPVVYVAKKELAKWPIFGRAIRSVGSPFVDRDSAHSRKSVAEVIAPFVKQGRQLAVFASGTTTLTEERPWRWGAFVIAKRHNIPIQPFRLRYKPARTVAYIDDDHFLKHLWHLLGTRHLEAEIEFAPPVTHIDDPEKEAQKWWHWVREKLVN